MSKAFDYQTAFSRNIGWVTPEEQQILRTKRIAIAGLGGVGGSHLLTLTRLGVGAFHVADLDTFELANFNRQAGASRSTLGEAKTEVLVRMATDINPELNIRLFSHGVQDTNVDEFLSEVDLYVDGIDFFAVTARRLVFAACSRLGIPAITAAPLGMGAALLNFLPGRMTFEQYFRLQDQTEEEQLLRFLLGLSPTAHHGAYLVRPSTINLAEHRGPSTAMGCELCAGMAATEALKILLGRGKTLAAPHGLQFDAFRHRLRHSWLPWGNHHPLQRLRLSIARRRLARMVPEPEPTSEATSPLSRIFSLARWAPSGDNTQPWRFEIIDDQTAIVHGHDTREHCVYDLQGQASQISLGAFLETLSIAASGEGMSADITYQTDSPPDHPRFVVRFSPGHAPHDPLYPYITTRTVHRRRLSTRRLMAREKQMLETALGPAFRIIWLEGIKKKLQTAWLNFANADLRLRMPEAYLVHRQVIAWNRRYSEDRIPDQALGVSVITRRIMRWAMGNWGRVNFLNRYLAGTVLPRIEMELIPGLACAGHFVIVADRSPTGVMEFVAAGRAIQRFWLTASRLGLQLQPEMTPLIFHGYLARDITFTMERPLMVRAKQISGRLCRLVGEQAAERAVFMGRLGAGQAAAARSTRRPLQQLVIDTQE